MTNTTKTKLNVFTDKPVKNQTLSEEQKELNKKITKILAELDPKEETVLRQRFGMSTNKPSTLEEVGEYIGVTRERIMQIEQNALKKLKESEEARKKGASED